MKKLRPILFAILLLAVLGILALRFRHEDQESLSVTEQVEPSDTPELTPSPTPRPTPKPTPSPTPTPEPTPDMSPLPAEWFDDSVFLGDSVTVALEKYCDKTETLGGALFLCEFSYSVRNAVSGEVDIWYQGNPYRPEDVIPLTGASKVFAMLGTNDIARSGGIDRTIELWTEMLDKIREKSPDVTFFLESCLPMHYAGQLVDLNNKKLDEYNERLRAYCEENGIVFVDIAAYFKDDRNSLRDDFSDDQYVHVTESAARLWAVLLKDPANYSINPRYLGNEDEE